MTITKYETRFIGLFNYANFMIRTEKEKARRFIDGMRGQDRDYFCLGCRDNIKD